MARYRYCIRWATQYGPCPYLSSDGDRDTPEERDAAMEECRRRIRARNARIVSARTWEWDKETRTRVNEQDHPEMLTPTFRSSGLIA